MLTQVPDIKWVFTGKPVSDLGVVAPALDPKELQFAETKPAPVQVEDKGAKTGDSKRRRLQSKTTPSVAVPPEGLPEPDAMPLTSQPFAGAPPHLVEPGAPPGSGSHPEPSRSRLPAIPDWFEASDKLGCHKCRYTANGCSVCRKAAGLVLSPGRKHYQQPA